jgi:hypothetical protein
MSSPFLPLFRLAAPLARVLPAVAVAFTVLAAQAQAEGDPPGRVAAVTERQGSVVFAPAGEEEWTELPLNRPLTQADRLWTDQGARVQIHTGNARVYLDDLSNLGIVELDDDTTHLSLTQGTLDAHVRELRNGERFEVGTPNLAARAGPDADWRLDVNPDTASTRVTVYSGQVTVYGDAGRAATLGAGQQATFVARDLEQVEADRRARDDFDQWVAEHNRQEAQSPTARYVPPEVIGAQQLDQHGVWSQDATYGAVWYPNVTVADWAPYRQGRWSWIAPWGWTWIDDAPWGFAPFHYGRWAMIGSRWAWVPGRMAARPVYAPALVAFVGGGSGGAQWSLRVGNSPGVAWYPLAPGEAWRPYYRASNVYVRNVNRSYPVQAATTNVYVNARHAGAVTAVRLEDFNRGRTVSGHWQRVDAGAVLHAPVATAPARPDWSRWERHERAVQVPQQVRAAPPAWARAQQQVVPQQQVQPAATGNPGQHRGWQRREEVQRDNGAGERGWGNGNGRWRRD